MFAPEDCQSSTFGDVFCRKLDRSWRITLIALLLLLFALKNSGPAQSSPAIAIGSALERLNGPWKFHTGDDAAWAQPGFDDSRWESVDLTATPGAHDADVGLSDYVPGWSARGHRGYGGYAWYRLRFSIVDPHDAVALIGPPAVDSAYQLFVDGKLLGGCGRFSGSVPVAFSVQPRLFSLPIPSGTPGTSLSLFIALRVWMGPWALADPNAGGIRVAPALGPASNASLLYEHQWAQTIWGYMVEVLEGGIFLALAALAFSLRASTRPRGALAWLGTALVLTACFRLNQAIFFWAQVESVQAFEMTSIVLLIPLCFGAWTVAWSRWFRLEQEHWMGWSCAVLTFWYIVAEFMARSWFHDTLPGWCIGVIHVGMTAIRLLFLCLTVMIIYFGFRRWRKEWGVALIALLLISIGQYAQEISALGIPGIWFPFGVGVSRTQFAYAGFDLFLFLWVLSRTRRLSDNRSSSAN